MGRRRLDAMKPGFKSPLGKTLLLKNSALGTHPSLDFAFNRFPRSSESLAGSSDKTAPPSNLIRQRRKRSCSKWLWMLAAFEQFDHSFKSVKVRQYTRRDRFPELPFKYFCVSVANPERDEGSNVAKYGLSDW